MPVLKVVKVQIFININLPGPVQMGYFPMSPMGYSVQCMRRLDSPLCPSLGLFERFQTTCLVGGRKFKMAKAKAWPVGIIITLNYQIKYITAFLVIFEGVVLG